MIKTILNDQTHRKRILLGQLGANGDCLYATAIARQIKQDYPGCHLTWAIGQRCRAILQENPYVDEVWEVEQLEHTYSASEWQTFEAEVSERKRRGDFDEVFLTQVSPGNVHNYVGSIRASIFRGYPRPITVPVAPVLHLTTEEKNKANDFLQLHDLGDKKQVVLFECSPKSEQSRVNPDYALSFARLLVAKYPDAVIILSSNRAIASDHANIIDGSMLSLRETAGIISHCSLLIGCSSGITWIATSEGIQAPPMIQLLVPDLIISNSVAYDYESRGVSTQSIIEMIDYPVERLVRCVETFEKHGIEQAKIDFHQKIPFKYNVYRNVQFQLLKTRQFLKSRLYLQRHLNEYGPRPRFFLELVLMFLKCYFPWPFTLLSRVRGIKRPTN